MSKKNGNGKNGTPANPSEINEALVAAQAEVIRLEGEAQAAMAKEAEVIREKVLALPAHLNVPTISDVLKLIRKTVKVPTSRKGRASLSESTVNDIIALAKAGELTRAEISAKVGCSVPSVQKVLSKAGLVKTRS